MEFCKQNYKFDIAVKTRLDDLLYYLIRGVRGVAFLSRPTGLCEAQWLIGQVCHINKIILLLG